jgi:hypothetical protein
MPSKVYWDSCCFIGLLQDEQDKGAALADLSQKAAVDDLVIVTSALAIAEVCKLPDTGLQPEDQAQKILAFFENPYIVVRSLDRMIAERQGPSFLLRRYPPSPLRRSWAREAPLPALVAHFLDATECPLPIHCTTSAPHSVTTVAKCV